MTMEDGGMTDWREREWRLVLQSSHCRHGTELHRVSRDMIRAGIKLLNIIQLSNYV